MLTASQPSEEDAERSSSSLCCWIKCFRSNKIESMRVNSPQGTTTQVRRTDSDKNSQTNQKVTQNNQNAPPNSDIAVRTEMSKSDKRKTNHPQPKIIFN